MTLNNLTKSTNTIQNQILMDLRDKLQAASIADPKNTMEASRVPDLIDAQTTLAVRGRKSSLNKVHISDVIASVNEINNSTNPYIKNKLKPLLMDSLQIENIGSMLTLMLAAYSKNTFGQDKPLLMNRNERNDFFKDKKHNIRTVLKDKYKNGDFDGKLIFGLGLVLGQDKNQISDKLKQFTAGSFREDTQKWLFNGDAHSFWNDIANPAPEMQANTETTTEKIGQTIAQANN